MTNPQLRSSSASVRRSNVLLIIMLSLAVQLTSAQSPTSIILSNSTGSQIVMLNGAYNLQFIPVDKEDCSMPILYTYNDSSHQNYTLSFNGVQFQSIEGIYSPINTSLLCASPFYCTVTINNNCQGNGKNQINLIKFTLSDYAQELQYKVNCAPDLFYKPFEWGLFILIILSTIIIVLSSLFSKAWSYGGFSVNINYPIIIAVNFIILVGIICAYFFPVALSLGLKLIGSGVGTLGVMVCFSETIYLLKIPLLKQNLFWKFRIIQIPSFLAGVIVTVVYWVTNAQWVVNDILAVCSIVAVIKIFKLRSLKMSIVLLMSLLLIQIIVGLVVHYALGTSYNNLVINSFESPIVVVFPSITPELYRKCAWLPVTSIIMPGLVISYMRRFDQSRSTYIYLLIGYISFFLGSIAWIFADMSTNHALPFAILSEPVMFIIVALVSWRRNQLKTLWQGRFYDVEVTDIGQSLLRETQTIDRINSMEFQRLGEEIKAENMKQSESEAQEI